MFNCKIQAIRYVHLIFNLLERLLSTINLCLEVLHTVRLEINNLRLSEKRIGDYTSKITSLTLPTTMWRWKGKMIPRMHYQLAAVRTLQTITLTCKKCMSKFISSPMLKNRQSERRKLRGDSCKRSTIRTI